MSTVLCVCFTVVLLRYLAKRRWSANLPYPPGPKPLPLLGNLLDIPSRFIWLKYDQWYKENQSDITYVNLAGTHLVILNTYEAAVELLEKRSALYSSRVRLPMVNELMGWAWNVGFMEYGDRWRLHRRVLHQGFNCNAAKAFESAEMKAALQLVRSLLDNPKNLMPQLRQMTITLILSVTYGIEVKPENDPFVALGEANLDALAKALQPGAFWVDIFPWMKYIPSWVPGAGFQRKATEWRKLAQDLLEKPFEAAKQKDAGGETRPSFVSRSLERLRNGGVPWTEATVQEVAGALYGAGVDTMSGALGSLIVALVTYPDVQKKVHEELDRVLKGSLPSFDDHDSLPYLAAIIYEALRWRNVVPTGLPHLLISEDVYNGYWIPPGTMVIANAWSMLYDEAVYPNPETFDPERFLRDGKLNPDIRDPRLLAFGFGRRACPGRHMAYSTIWITAALMLSTLEFRHAKDKNGNTLDPSGEYEAFLGFVPKTVECDIITRSGQSAALVRAAVLDGDF